MLPNFDQREMPRALQHLAARGQARVATALPRRSFLKLAGAGGLAALGCLPRGSDLMNAVALMIWPLWL